MTPDHSVRRVAGRFAVVQTFEVDLRCLDCGHFYTRKVKAKSELELQGKPNPPCPKCKKIKKKQEPIDWNKIRHAPGVVGSDTARAMDAGAEIAMADYGLTDIKGPTEVKYGERAAPRLAPHLQAQADSFFGGPRNGPKKFNLPKIGGMDPNSEAFRRAVIGGAFSAGGAAESSAAIASSHAKREVPQFRIINEGKK